MRKYKENFKCVNYYLHIFYFKNLLKNNYFDKIKTLRGKMAEWLKAAPC